MSSHFVLHRAGRDSLSLPGGRQIGANALEHFRRHADRFAQGRMRMDRLANVYRIAAHFDGEANLADQIAGARIT